MGRTVKTVCVWECDICGRKIYKSPDSRMPKGWRIRHDGLFTCWRRRCKGSKLRFIENAKERIREYRRYE